MSRTLKISAIIAMIIVIFMGISMASSGNFVVGSVCMLGWLFILFTGAFFVVFKVAKVIKYEETKIFYAFKDEMYNGSSRNSYTSSATMDMSDPYKGVESSTLPHSGNSYLGSGAKVFNWNGFVITLGDEEFMGKMKIPHAGMLVDRDDFIMFRRLPRLDYSEYEVFVLAQETVEDGIYDVVMAWDGKYEIACGKEEYIRAAYGVGFGGMVVRDGDFLHLLGHGCRNMTKRKMLESLRKNLNRNEEGFVILTYPRIIMYLEEDLMVKSFSIPREMLVIMNLDKSTIYVYDVPFKIRSRDEIWKISREMERNHSEVGVLITDKEVFISILKRHIAVLVSPKVEESKFTSNGEIVWSTKDLMFVDVDGKVDVREIEWRPWTEKELERVVREYGIF